MQKLQRKFMEGFLKYYFETFGRISEEIFARISKFIPGKTLKHFLKEWMFMPEESVKKFSNESVEHILQGIPKVLSK